MGVEHRRKELAMTLLASLSEDLKPLITALDAVGEADLSYQKVKNMLLNDVDRSNDAKNIENALSARRGKFMGNYTKPVKAQIRMKGKCFKEVSQLSRERTICAKLPKDLKSDWATNPGKDRKPQGDGRRTEKQNIGDQFPAETSPV